MAEPKKDRAKSWYDEPKGEKSKGEPHKAEGGEGEHAKHPMMAAMERHHAERHDANKRHVKEHEDMSKRHASEMEALLKPQDEQAAGVPPPGGAPMGQPQANAA